MGNALGMQIVQGEGNLLGNNTSVVVVKMPAVRLSVREEVACWCKVCENIPFVD
jgi:hypothetical protein